MGRQEGRQNTGMEALPGALPPPCLVPRPEAGGGAALCRLSVFTLLSRPLGEASTWPRGPAQGGEEHQCPKSPPSTHRGDSLLRRPERVSDPLKTSHDHLGLAPPAEPRWGWGAGQGSPLLVFRAVGPAVRQAQNRGSSARGRTLREMGVFIQEVGLYTHRPSLLPDSHLLTQTPL